MDEITETIIKLVRLRYPLVRVSCSPDGAIAIDAPADHMAEVADDYMRGLQFLAVSQPADLALLERAIEEDICGEERTSETWRQRGPSTTPAYDEPIYLAYPELYAKFGRLGSWTLHEAVTLTLGGNPDTFREDRIIEWAERGGAGDFFERYTQVMRLAISHVGGSHGKLSDPISPSAFLWWADRMRLAVPIELREAVQATQKSLTELPKALFATQSSSGAAGVEAMPKERAQENAILKWLMESGYEPEALLKAPPGKAGVKASAREALIKSKAIFSSGDRFDAAWERLRRDGRIKDAKYPTSPP